MPQIQLIGGELDGMEISISSAQARPDIYYAVPLKDEPRVRQTKGAKARGEVRSRLAVLAYTFDRTVRRDRIGWEYCYVRDPEYDKKPVVSDGNADQATG